MEKIFLSIQIGNFMLPYLFGTSSRLLYRYEKNWSIFIILEKIEVFFFE